MVSSVVGCCLVLWLSVFTHTLFSAHAVTSFPLIFRTRGMGDGVHHGYSHLEDDI